MAVKSGRTRIRLIAATRDLIEASGHAEGCRPIATVAFETAAGKRPLQRFCADVYDTWTQALADRLRVGGHPAEKAGDLAATALTLIEGALVPARSRLRRPVEQAGHRLRTFPTP
jgi:TetR/AcrR family transcriptional repressor of lmrAB and yxaGH operons